MTLKSSVLCVFQICSTAYDSSRPFSLSSLLSLSVSISLSLPPQVNFQLRQQRLWAHDDSGTAKKNGGAFAMTQPDVAPLPAILIASPGTGRTLPSLMRRLSGCFGHRNSYIGMLRSWMLFKTRDWNLQNPPKETSLETRQRSFMTYFDLRVYHSEVLW